MNLTRRTFLRGVGGVTVALPLLEATAGRAWAQGEGPRRFIVFMTPQGFVMDAWRPTGNQTSWQLSEILQPLSPYKAKLNVIDNLTNEVNYLNRLSNGHNTAARTLLTSEPFAGNVDGNGNLRSTGQQVDNGFANGPSLDQVIANGLNAGTAFRSLEFGVGGREVHETQILHAGPNDPIAVNADPRDVFSRLFSDLPAPGSGSAAPPPPPTGSSNLDRIRARRGSVLDSVLGSFRRVQARLGAEDRERLEAHADKIRTLEARFPDGGNRPPVSQDCEQPQLPTFPGGYNPENPFFDDSTGPAMIDQMVMAMTCDLTRVGTIQFTKYNSPTFPWLGVNVPGGFTNWHAMIHEAGTGPAQATLVRAQTWYAEMFAYLLSRLDGVQEGTGTMLDNSLVLWVTDFGDAATHQTYDMPFLTAGSLGGTVPTDRYLDGQRRSHSDLYVSILNAFGIPDQTFGWREFSNGPLPGFIA